MPFRLFAVEVIVERQPPVLTFFTDEDEAWEYARLVRREATNAGKAVRAEPWEMTANRPVCWRRMKWEPKPRH